MCLFFESRNFWIAFFSLWLLVWTTNGQNYRTAKILNRAEITAWLVFTNRSSEILICNNCTAGDDGPHVPTYHCDSDFYAIAEQITLFHQEAVGLKCNFLHSMMTQEVHSENKTSEVYWERIAGYAWLFLPLANYLRLCYVFECSC